MTPGEKAAADQVLLASVFALGVIHKSTDRDPNRTMAASVQLIELACAAGSTSRTGYQALIQHAIDALRSARDDADHYEAVRDLSTCCHAPAPEPRGRK